jgi:hypothetical protein
VAMEQTAVLSRASRAAFGRTRLASQGRKGLGGETSAVTNRKAAEDLERGKGALTGVQLARYFSGICGDSPFDLSPLLKC